MPLIPAAIFCVSVSLACRVSVQNLHRTDSDQWNRKKNVEELGLHQTALTFIKLGLEMG